MIAVTLYGLEKGGPAVQGVLGWDGSAWRGSGDSTLLNTLLEQPVISRGRRITSGEDPEGFLKGMEDHYRSAYLRAGPAGEHPAGDLKPIED